MSITNKPTVLMAGNTNKIIRDILEPHTQLLFCKSNADRTALKAALQTAEGLIPNTTLKVSSELLEQAPHLRVISQCAVGVDNIDLAACTARNIPVGHTPGVLNEATADLFFGLMLAAARRIAPGWEYVKSGAWAAKQSFSLGTDLYGKTLGIAGMGRIGTAVAKRAQASGMSVIYNNRHKRSDDEQLKVSFVSFPELLAQSDFLLILVPLTKASRYMFSTAEFAAMKPTAYLINGARGQLVDSDALYLALESGDIAFAALDVTEPEPLPATHKLLTLDNILIVPHIGSASKETRTAMARLAAQNMLAGLAGRPLTACANNTVNFQ